VKVVYSPRYAIDIGPHVFPTRKYQLVSERVCAARLNVDIVAPEPVSWTDLALVHTPEYLRKIRTGTLDPGELAQLEIPWSAEVVEGFRLMTGGTLSAARLAASDGTCLAAPQ